MVPVNLMASFTAATYVLAVTSNAPAKNTSNVPAELADGDCILKYNVVPFTCHRAQSFSVTCVLSAPTLHTALNEMLKVVAPVAVSGPQKVVVVVLGVSRESV